MADLLPCPHCGHTPDLNNLEDSLHPIRRSDGLWEFSCLYSEGGCDASVIADSRDKAIAAWNRRTPSPASHEQVEALRKMRRHLETTSYWPDKDALFGLVDDAFASIDALAKRAESAEALVGQLRKDAERYRWLRNAPPFDGWLLENYPTPPWCIRCELDHSMPTNKFIAGADLDASIDAAIQQEKSNG